MSIRPVDFNGMIQRTQDIGTIKQNEDNRPTVEQQNIQIQQKQQQEELSHKVQKSDEKDTKEYRYDAKEGKNGGGRKGSQKKKQNQKEPEEDGKVIFKGQSRRFDMKI